MRFAKRYGQSRVDNCPFCSRKALAENPQGVPVCIAHKRNRLYDLKCLCGDWLDIRKGKFGAFFTCMKCGNVPFQRGIDANPQVMIPESVSDIKINEPKDAVKKTEEKKPLPKERKEIFVTSRELDLL